jgi:hypothetical protein
MDLPFLHRKELLFVAKPHLRKDHHDVSKIIWSREFDFRLLARRHIVGLAGRLRDRNRELDGPAWVVRQALLLHCDIQDVGEDSEFPMNRSRLHGPAKLEAKLRLNPATRPKPFRQVVFDCLRGEVRKRNLTKDRSEEFHRVQILLVISLAPERGLGALQEPVRPLPKRQQLAP